MVTVLSGTSRMLFDCAVAVRSPALIMLICLAGNLRPPLENQELPAETKSRDILIQIRENAIVTNIPRPP